MNLSDTEKIKYASSAYGVMEIIRKRWSGRAYSGEPLSDEDVLRLIEAAHWAPSSMNEQPWKYYYALQGSNEFKEMADLLMDGNKVWAQNAGALLLCTARKTFLKNGQTNRHYLHDTGAANAQLTLQATEMELNVHMLGGYFHKSTIDRFQLDPNEEPVCFLAVGKRMDAQSLDEPFKSRELMARTRKPIEEVAEKWEG